MSMHSAEFYSLLHDRADQDNPDYGTHDTDEFLDMFDTDNLVDMFQNEPHICSCGHLASAHQLILNSPTGYFDPKRYPCTKCECANYNEDELYA